VGTPRYYRLHGTALGGFRYDYDHLYTDPELKAIREECSAGDTYCLFNNKQMADDALRFERLVSDESSVSLYK
jgi:uncharacterized protein YecE (DUF72 family)